MIKQLSQTILFVGAVFIFSFCSKPASKTKGTSLIPASDSSILYLGRIDFKNPQSVSFAHTGVSIRFRFEGPTCILHLKNKSINKDKEGVFYKNYYTVIIDKEKPQLISVSNSDNEIKLKGLGSGIHEVTIFKRTEALVGEGIFEGMDIEKDKKLLPIETLRKRKIEFIGNSITCGYGIEGTSEKCNFSPETENGYLAYGAVTARKLEADYIAVAYSGKGMYRNYDGTTTNTMSLIYDRIFPDSLTSPKWKTNNWQPDLVVVNLGTNDFAKGIPDSMVFINTYVNFIKRLISYYPNATILCTEGPMTNDAYPVGAYAFSKVKNYINASKDKINALGTAKIYSFFPTPQGPGEYGCDYHPNVKRQQKLADEITKEIKTIMKW